METMLRNMRPTAKQMYLDPRTKIFLCLTVTFITLADGGGGIMKYIKIGVAIIPLIFLLVLKKKLLVVYYVGLYIFSSTVPYLLMPYLPGVVNFLFTGVILASTQVIPSMSMFCFLVMTTTVSEFIAAMDSMHIPKKFSVPVSSMFRFFPTIKEEYTAIRDAMRLRNVGSWRNPIEMLEYRMVPLLMELVSIGNELSASALTRGLDAPRHRTNMCPIGFHWQDVFAAAFCAGVIILFILSNIFGW